jgi:two-component system response regulator DctR
MSRLSGGSWQSFSAVRATACVKRPAGREGIAAIKQARPNLVILDLYMPTCDGVEVLREVRQLWPAEWPFGVIVLTGSHDLPILEAALALGAFEVLLKPISMDELDLAVRRQLALKPPSDPGSRGGTDRT